MGDADATSFPFRKCCAELNAMGMHCSYGEVLLFAETIEWLGDERDQIGPHHEAAVERFAGDLTAQHLVIAWVDRERRRREQIRSEG